MKAPHLPDVRVPPPGPKSRAALVDLGAQAPMGPRGSGAPIVLAHGHEATVTDVDGNRYVDLAAGFGALLLGHAPAALQEALAMQAARLWQAMGDVLPSDTKLQLLRRLAGLHPAGDARVILGQSGADAVTAAIKTALLHTGKTGLLAFHGSYHGLSYGALGITDLRRSYRAPFAEHLPPDVTFLPYPSQADEARAALVAARQALGGGNIAALVIEPILGRGGVVVPPAGFLAELEALCREHGTLVVMDEIWTGLGRAGSWLAHGAEGVTADLICLGKGLGGGLPLSACVGRGEVMAAWSREEEVVHTSTFAGAPLACALALALLDTLEQGQLVQKSAQLGAEWKARLEQLLAPWPEHRVRGRGLMLGIDCARIGAVRLHQRLLARGFVTSTGGGKRDVLVLTPPLTVTRDQLAAFDAALVESLSS